ncbi:UDP-glucose 4-epimerase family protein [Vibrio sinaloensis]|uniref:UDP-glucose 4-epimerase family protein n=1 Tax=Photobacterium sp. (strain ATCC 43367) TaxID=379097 RepID=UPI0022AF8E3C|nr:SDR family oxidoreductase [Vibrio sinaloensis]MCZ4294815.1 SDR family oxidoreductase [Vibrio sinaloensis]
MKLLITGSSGFVGSRLLEKVRALGTEPCLAVRKPMPGCSAFLISGIDSQMDWSEALEGIDCVVHCAARVHQMNDSASDLLEAYREVNTRGTLNLARQTAQAGVKRFVFISSIKVNGEFSPSGHPFQPDLVHVPDDPYGLSKYEAEVQLRELAEKTGLEVVIIRPPLVYGPGVKANFLSMMHWVEKGIPLPLGAIHNSRSFVYVDNLVDLILTCCKHPKAAGETFLVSDGTDVSTTQLLKAVALSMNKRVHLLPIPMPIINFSSKLIGKPQISQRLCGSLQVDISHTRKILEWEPPVTFEQGLKRTAQAYLDSR